MIQPYEKYLKEKAQKLRTNQTDSERKLWQRINEVKKEEIIVLTHGIFR